MCEIITREICEGRNVPLDLRGAKRVRGEMCECPIFIYMTVVFSICES